MYQLNLVVYKITHTVPLSLYFTLWNKNDNNIDILKCIKIHNQQPVNIHSDPHKKHFL